MYTFVFPNIYGIYVYKYGIYLCMNVWVCIYGKYVCMDECMGRCIMYVCVFTCSSVSICTCLCTYGYFNLCVCHFK